MFKYPRRFFYHDNKEEILLSLNDSNFRDNPKCQDQCYTTLRHYTIDCQKANSNTVSTCKEHAKNMQTHIMFIHLKVS